MDVLQALFSFQTMGLILSKIPKMSNYSLRIGNCSGLSLQLGDNLLDRDRLLLMKNIIELLAFLVLQASHASKDLLTLLWAKVLVQSL